jgi:DNA-binding Lrp family transcriptional regulator
MYVYLFFGDTEGTPDQLGDPEAVTYLAVTTGPYGAIGKVEVENLADLKDILAAVHEAGGRSVETAVAIAGVPGTTFPRGISLDAPAVEAFVQIWVDPGAGDEVLHALDRFKGVSGLAAVAGDFDILAVVGGRSFDDLAETIMEGLQHIDGISATTTSFIVAEVKRRHQAS